MSLKENVMTKEDLKTLKNLGHIKKDIITKSGKYKIEMTAFGVGKTILGRLIRLKDSWLVNYNVLSYDTIDELVKAWNFNCVSMQKLADRH